MNVLGYLRVSTREQADSGLGLDAQRAAITAEADRRGWTARFLVDDGYTAANLHRPAVREALQALASGEAQALVVAKVDRLARSMPDFAGLMLRAEKQRWSIVALDLGVDMTTPAGEFMAHVVAAAAQYERRLIADRTRDAMAEAKARGVHCGRERMTPPGVVARVMAEREAGRSFNAIALGLDADGVPTPNGGSRWYPSTVTRLYAAEQRKAVA